MSAVDIGSWAIGIVASCVDYAFELWETMLDATGSITLFLAMFVLLASIVYLLGPILSPLPAGKSDSVGRRNRRNRRDR